MARRTTGLRQPRLGTERGQLAPDGCGSQSKSQGYTGFSFGSIYQGPFWYMFLRQQHRRVWGEMMALAPATTKTIFSGHSELNY